MRKAISCLGLISFLAIALAGCGGGMSSSLAPSGTNTAQVSLTIHDNPPMGVTVLSFEIEVTGASLQPSDSSSQPVSMLSEPEDIELEHLQTESALLASKSVPMGSYSGLTATFANPRMTIQNQTGMTLTLGSQSCADQQVCEFDPKLNQSSVTVQSPTQPFPITLSANSPVVLKMDFQRGGIRAVHFDVRQTGSDCRGACSIPHGFGHVDADCAAGSTDSAGSQQQIRPSAATDIQNLFAQNNRSNDMRVGYPCERSRGFLRYGG
jgi:hypothetical protein